MNGKGWGDVFHKCRQAFWERIFPIGHYLDLALNTQEISILTGPTFLQLHPRVPLVRWVTLVFQQGCYSMKSQVISVHLKKISEQIRLLRQSPNYFSGRPEVLRYNENRKINRLNFQIYVETKEMHHH